MPRSLSLSLSFANFNFNVTFLTFQADGQNFHCLQCYDAHHGKFCRRRFERCFECHVPAQEKSDYASNCSVSSWYCSEAYVDMYVLVPVVRATIKFDKPVHYVFDRAFVAAVEGAQLFSGMADVLVEFASPLEITIATTGFTRVRLSIIVRERNGLVMERLVFLTSQDRTIVAAHSARLVNPQNLLQDVEHNTPLVLYFTDGCPKVSIDVAGNSGRKFDIGVMATANGHRFDIPEDLDIKSRTAMPNLFDAEFPSKKMKRY